MSFVAALHRRPEEYTDFAFKFPLVWTKKDGLGKGQGSTVMVSSQAIRFTTDGTYRFAIGDYLRLEIQWPVMRGEVPLVFHVESVVCAIKRETVLARIGKYNVEPA